MTEHVSRKHDIKVAAISCAGTLAVIAALLFALVVPAEGAPTAQVSANDQSGAGRAVCAVVKPSHDALCAHVAALQQQAQADQAAAAAAAEQALADQQQAASQGNAAASSTSAAPQAVCPRYPDGGCPYGGTPGACGHQLCPNCPNATHNPSDCPYRNNAPANDGNSGYGNGGNGGNGAPAQGNGYGYGNGYGTSGNGGHHGQHHSSRHHG